MPTTPESIVWRVSTLGRARRLVREAVGIDVRRVPRSTAPAVTPPLTAGGRPLSKRTTIFDVDEQFHSLYSTGAQRSESGGTGADERLWQLVQVLDTTRGIDGLIAECGFFRGLSAWGTCQYLRLEDPFFRGDGFHIFDSFEGLSEPGPQDRDDAPGIPVTAGLYRAALEDAHRMMCDFPGVAFHQGWIPDVFSEAPDGPYRMVHVDVDLHDPTRDSVRFFYPRLAPGGALVCDDYGFIRWPGAKEAVDRLVGETGARLLRLSTGQAVLFAP